jgi:hypothetical protein
VEPRIERLVEIVRLTCWGQKETKVVNVLLPQSSQTNWQIGQTSSVLPACQRTSIYAMIWQLRFSCKRT